KYLFEVRSIFVWRPWRRKAARIHESLDPRFYRRAVDVLSRDVLIFLLAVIATLQVPNNVCCSRQSRGSRCPRTNKPSKILWACAEKTRELVLVHGNSNRKLG